MRALLIVLFTTLPGLPGLPALAQGSPNLVFPVECTLGETCMIQQLMDRDPGPGARDYLCGPMSYDDHSGTDIRVPDMEALAQGVQILAAAPGTVRGIRNTVPDTGLGGFPEGQDCGNGVLIDHENGWQTQYCHMAQGSISVASDDVVEAGQPIGRMGFSGNTEFPHLQITVRQNGEDVDPFDPSTAGTCGVGAAPLWADEIPVAPGGILSIGFAESLPEFASIRAGTADADTLSPNGEAFVIWGFFHGGREGDIITLNITAPDGTVFHTRDVTLDRTQAELFRASGRRIRTPLSPGTYSGTVTLTRDGTQIDAETATIPIR